MHHFGNNLKFLRKQKSLTQQQLANKIGITRSIIGAYEENRAEPKLNTLQNFCHYFEVNLDDLINRDLTKSKGTQPSFKDTQLRILPILVNKEDDHELCTVVPIQASAGYTTGYGDIDFIEQLPKFSLPFPELSNSRTYRIFQIKGESMLPVKPKSYVITEYESDWQNIKNEACYILVTRNEGIVYKRVLNNLNDGFLVCKSDNPEYTAYNLESPEIIEAWKALGIVSFELPDVTDADLLNSDLNSKFNDLKHELTEIKKKL